MNTSSLFSAALLGLLCVTVQAAEPPPPPPLPDEPGRERIEMQMQKAQEQLERSAQEIAELSSRLNGAAWAQAPWMEMAPPRAMLGINIGSTKGGASDSADGVRIVSVSPGGPADVAGLKANDVIVSLDGKDLHTDAKSNASHQLLAIMREAQPDSSIALEYQRDGKRQKAQVVPKSLSQYISDSVSHSLQGPQMFEEQDLHMGRHEPGGFDAVELTELSPGLGHYFGTDKGLLVVRAPKDERLKLQDGDVILDIDGRVPGNVSHAYQILSSYHGGETLKLHIMRQQKRLELPVQIPPGHAHSQPSRFLPPVPRIALPRLEGLGESI